MNVERLSAGPHVLPVLHKALHNLSRRWAPAFAVGCFADTRQELARTLNVLHRTEDELRLELAVGAALRDLYKPLISPGSTIHEMASVVLEKARHLTGSAYGYVSAIDPATGDNVGHTLNGAQVAECMLEGRRGPSRRARGRYSPAGHCRGSA